jgi:hypothetical protein
MLIFGTTRESAAAAAIFLFPFSSRALICVFHPRFARRPVSKTNERGIYHISNRDFVLIHIVSYGGARVGSNYWPIHLSHQRPTHVLSRRALSRSLT